MRFRASDVSFYRERTFNECLQEFCFRSHPEAPSNAFFDDPYALSSPWCIPWKQPEQLCFEGVVFEDEILRNVSRNLPEKPFPKPLRRRFPSTITHFRALEISCFQCFFESCLLEGVLYVNVSRNSASETFPKPLPMRFFYDPYALLST